MSFWLGVTAYATSAPIRSAEAASAPHRKVSITALRLPTIVFDVRVIQYRSRRGRIIYIM
jgi:hypothetical protein